jgi:hypothetical protein
MKATLVIVENDRDHQQAKARVSAGRRRQSMNRESSFGLGGAAAPE